MRFACRWAPVVALILEGASSVDQSMLTGESVPLDAARGSVIHASALVRRGQAIAEVKATGLRTRFGCAA
jgi:H+-transporting ATPase